MGTTEAVLVASCSATSRAVLVAGVGFLCAVYPKGDPMLTPVAVRYISRLAMDIFQPSLSAASVGSSMDAERLRSLWVLPVLGFLTTTVSYVIADVTALIFRPQPQLAPALRVAMAHPNAFSYPLLVLASLCEHDLVNADYSGDVAQCTADGVSMLMVYLATWHFLFWGYGYRTLVHAASTAQGGDQSTVELAPLTADPREESLQEEGRRRTEEPGEGADVAYERRGARADSATSQQSEVSDDFAVVTLEDKGRLQDTRPLPEPGNSDACARLVQALTAAGSFVLKTLAQPNMLGMMFGIFVSLTPLREMLFMSTDNQSIAEHEESGPAAVLLRPMGGTLETLGMPVVATTTMILGAVLANGQIRSQEKREASPQSDGAVAQHRRQQCFGIDLRTGLWFVAGRLVLTPALCCGLLTVFRPRLPASWTHMMQLVVMLESAVPGAQTVIMCLNSLNMVHVAEDMSPYYFLQYFASIITLTAFTSWGLLIIYQDA